MTAPRLSVSAGDGFVARRDRAVLFVPTDGPGARGLLDAFADPADDDAAVASCCELLDGRDGATPLDAVLLGWSDGVRVVCSGDVEVRSDHPGLSMISSRSSSSWVERRLAASSSSSSIVFESGSGGSDDTELGAGRVRGGGFRLLLSPQPSTRPAPEPEHAPEPAPEPLPTPTILDRFASVGDDWMEESLGVQAPAPRRTEPDTPDAPEVPDVERTIGSDGRPLPGASTPVWPEPADAPEPAPAPEPPVLAVLHTPNGATHAVRRDVVIGRRGARADDDLEVVVVDHPSVSRRHAWIRVRDGGLVVRDVGSTGGTALIRPDGDVVELEPEVDHPLEVGAALLLGGPTRVEVFAGPRASDPVS